MSVSLLPPVTLPDLGTRIPLPDSSNFSGDALSASKKLEGMFLSLLIKEMRETSNGEGLFPGDSAGVYGGLFDQMLGDYLAEHSAGIGISRYVAASLSSPPLPSGSLQESSG